jgi:hypothetical protein
MLGRRDHAHINILLVCSLDLLLLLLQKLDLLLNGKLLHYSKMGGQQYSERLDDDNIRGGGDKHKNLLPGEENMLMRGVSSEGLLR